VATRIAINNVYNHVQDALGVDWPDNMGAMNRSLISYLLNRGYTEEQIIGCAGFLCKKTQGTVMAYDMRKIRTIIGKWVTSGEPEKPFSARDVVRVGKAQDYGPSKEKAERQKRTWGE